MPISSRDQAKIPNFASRELGFRPLPKSSLEAYQRTIQAMQEFGLRFRLPPPRTALERILEDPDPFIP